MVRVRIAELSRYSDVTIPTIKYYLREGLLPPGELTGRNQATYDKRHLERLRLIRALREVGGLSVSATREVLAVLDQPEITAHELMGRAHRAVRRRPVDAPADPAADHDWTRARTDAAEQIRLLGWTVDPDAPALDQLADVILALRRVGRADIIEAIPQYAEAALSVAQWEVRLAAADPDPATVLTTVVTGTVLGEALLATVRLLAHEHVSARLLAPPDQPGAAGRD
jgi:DNA-binding transcriptional MerR regulator